MTYYKINNQHNKSPHYRVETITSLLYFFTKKPTKPTFHGQLSYKEVLQLTKQKKLTLAHIRNDNKKYSEMKKVTFDDDTYLHINKYFSPQKIDEMLVSFAESLQSMEKAGVNFQEKELIDFLMLHVFKHFSSLSSDIPDDFETKLQVFDVLMKSTYAEKLAESYDPEQLTLVFDRIIKKLDAAGKMQELQYELRSKLKGEIDKLDNAEIIKAALNFEGENIGEDVQ